MANVLNRKIKQAGVLIVGGVIGITAAVGGGTYLNKVDNSGNRVDSQITTLDQQFLVNVTATGSTDATTRYDAICIPNPITKLSTSLGSGTVVRLTYHNITNPGEVGGDLGFVESCDSKSASGQSIINNSCTSTGCTSYYTTGTAVWNGAQYLKLTLRDDPTDSYSARITGIVEDVYGE